MTAQAAIGGAAMLLAACSTAQAPADSPPLHGVTPGHKCDPANIQIDSNRWLNPDTQSAFNDLISQFWTDDSMTVEEAQQKYADILKAAQ